MAVIREIISDGSETLWLNCMALFGAVMCCALGLFKWFRASIKFDNKNLTETKQSECATQGGSYKLIRMESSGDTSIPIAGSRKKIDPSSITLPGRTISIDRKVTESNKSVNKSAVVTISTKAFQAGNNSQIDQIKNNIPPPPSMPPARVTNTANINKVAGTSASRVDKKEEMKKEKKKAEQEFKKEKKKEKKESNSKSSTDDKPKSQVLNNKIVDNRPYSTNTIGSTTSTSTPPPPYTESATSLTVKNRIESKTDISGNISFAKSDADFNSWDLVSQHRQNLRRPKNNPAFTLPPNTKRDLNTQGQLSYSVNSNAHMGQLDDTAEA